MTWLVQDSPSLCLLSWPLSHSKRPVLESKTQDHPQQKQLGGKGKKQTKGSCFNNPSEPSK